MSKNDELDTLESQGDVQNINDSEDDSELTNDSEQLSDTEVEAHHNEKESEDSADQRNDYDLDRLELEKLLRQDKKLMENASSKSSAVIKELLTYAIIFLLCVFIIPRYVVQKTIVDGESMEDTLKDKDHLLVEKVSYRFTDPSRFDIVVFHPYGKDSEEYYVKRVIGLPGETVQIIGSDIFINGEKLEENYGKEPIDFAGIAKDPITLSSDEFFLLGDNRRISLDSRWEQVGLVPRDYIEGHAMVRIWPLNSFGFFHD